VVVVVVMVVVAAEAVAAGCKIMTLKGQMTFTGLHDIIFQKLELFIITAVGTLNPIYIYISHKPRSVLNMWKYVCLTNGVSNRLPGPKFVNRHVHIINRTPDRQNGDNVPDMQS
jgi:hypothetical protein